VRLRQKRSLLAEKALIDCQRRGGGREAPQRRNHPKGGEEGECLVETDQGPGGTGISLFCQASFGGCFSPSGNGDLAGVSEGRLQKRPMGILKEG